MQQLAALLARRTPSGLYRLQTRVPAARLARRFAASGWHAGLIDGRAVTAKPALLGALAAALRFPAYFGANWDALADSLTDLSWLPAPGYALLIDHAAPLIDHAPEDWAVASDILLDAAGWWQARGVGFYVLLRGTGSLAPNIPAL